MEIVKSILVIASLFFYFFQNLESAFLASPRANRVYSMIQPC